MSDAMTNREIEDVLTSIRRLVAQEVTRPAESGRLILTEAQRVGDCEPADPLVLAVSQPAVEGAFSLPAPDFGKLEATIAELEAAVCASGGAWESEPGDEQPRASNVTALYGRMAFVHRATMAEQPGGGDDGAQMAPDDDGVDAEDGPSPVAATEAVVAGEAGETGAATDAQADPVPDRVAAAADAEGVEVVTTPDHADDDGLGDDPFEAVIDEAALHALVAQIVRDELHGQLGERITAQVRKLVRAEIAKALDERAFL